MSTSTPTLVFTIGIISDNPLSPARCVSRSCKVKTIEEALDKLCATLLTGPIGQALLKDIHYPMEEKFVFEYEKLSDLNIDKNERHFQIQEEEEDDVVDLLEKNPEEDLNV